MYCQHFLKWSIENYIVIITNIMRVFFSILPSTTLEQDPQILHQDAG